MASPTSCYKFNSIKIIQHEKQKFNENTFVTKLSQALHSTWKFRSELNSKEQQIGARQAVEDKSKTIFARCICSRSCSLWYTALSSLLFYAIIFRDFMAKLCDKLKKAHTYILYFVLLGVFVMCVCIQLFCGLCHKYSKSINKNGYDKTPSYSCIGVPSLTLLVHRFLCRN